MFSQTSIKRRLAHIAFLECFIKADLLFFIFFHDLRKVGRRLNYRSAEFYSTKFCGGKSFCLPFAYIFTLTLRNEAQNLKHQISNKCSHQILAVAGVKQRHINNTNVNSDFFCQNPPLLLYFFIIAPKPVDAQNIEQIAGFQFFYKLLYCGLSKSLPDCLSTKMFLGAICLSRIAINCLSSF